MKFLIAFCLLSFPLIAKEKCHPKGDTYKVCQDQEKIFASSLKKAQQDHKKLLIKFGFNTCAWCISLHKMFHNQKNWKTIEDHFVLSEIGVYRYDRAKKKNSALESGQKVLKKVMGQALAPMPKEKMGYPLLAVYNPKTQKSVLIDTANLEHNIGSNKGHDWKKVKMALKEALKKL